MNRDARRTGALGLLALLVGALSIAPPTGVEAVVTFGLSSNYVDSGTFTMEILPDILVTNHVIGSRTLHLSPNECGRFAYSIVPGI